MEGEKDHFKQFDLPEHGPAWTLAVTFRLLWLIGAVLIIYHLGNGLVALYFIEAFSDKQFIFRHWYLAVTFLSGIIIVAIYTKELFFSYIAKTRRRTKISLALLLVVLPLINAPSVPFFSEFIPALSILSLDGLILCLVLAGYLGLSANRAYSLLTGD